MNSSEIISIIWDMVVEVNPKTSELWQIIETSVEPIIAEVSERGLLTARRIKSVLSSNREKAYLKPLFQPGFFEPEVYMTDRPGKVFESNQTVYTITSSLALENNRDGEILLPPSVHNESRSKIATHRGIGLALFSRLMQGFGFGVGAKDSFVWLGPKIDGEQFVLEDNMAKSGHDIDKILAEQLFTHGDVKKNYAQLALHPVLKNVIEAISRGENLYESDEASRKYIDKLLSNLHLYTGVREGWFNALEGLLTGTIPPRKKIDPVDLDFSLTFAAHELALESPKRSQAIVIAVDMQKLIELTPIYAFPLGSRPPETIVPTLHVPLDAVKQIYTENRIDLPISDKPIKQLSDLPSYNWLQDDQDNHITPDRARRMGVNPRAPVCALRYNRNPVATWASFIENGDIAPFSMYEWVDLCDPKTFTEHALRKIVVDRATHSGLLTQIEQQMHDKDLAIRRILSDVTDKLALPTVKFVDKY